MGDDAGLWEERLVAQAASGTLTLSSPLSHTYVSDGANNRAQVVLVPQYGKVTMSGGYLTAPAWNGETGGLLALTVQDEMLVSAGSVTMNHRGFRGTGHGCLYRCKTGFSGESAAGPGSSTTVANWMGGGGGEQGQDCGGGGGGGYSTFGGYGSFGSCGACRLHCPIWGGEQGQVGGDEDLGAVLLFGGAGGEGGGDEDGSNPGKGGNSGGAILLQVFYLTVQGSISNGGQNGANGLNSGCGAWGCGMGGGGGGAGGAIYIVSEDAKLGAGKVTSTGGAGGNCTCGNSYWGGAGSVGRIGVAAGQTEGATVPDYADLSD